ncbi:MAG: PBSX family phage terminase large subunit [Sulfuricaulis sp.]|nr:PBSX family phage terminase large subunit [Sulfuricaulis sp.]
MQAEFPEPLRILFQPARYKVLYGGRGGAKSWGVARALLIDGVQRPIRVLCAREFQNSIRDSVLKLLADQIEALGLQGHYEVQAQAIKGANGSEFAFEGLRQNVGRIRSYEGVDRVWVEEAQSVTKASWNVLIPTIRKDDSEIWMTLNPEFEDDETYSRFIQHPPSNALVREVNWRDNPWFPKVLEEERQDLIKRDPDSYDHVWEGKCRQWLEGAIYAKELRKAYDEKRITEVEYDDEASVFTAWDLGRTDDTAIWWFQVVHGEIHVLECYASSGGSLSEYAEQILGRKVQIDLIDDDVVATLGPWKEELAHRRFYRYATHWLPHDARAKTLAAKGKSIIQQLSAALPLKSLAIVPDIGLENGIQASRMMFHRVWLDKDKCEDGLKALRRYQRVLQPDQRSLQQSPKHDWTSHYADAWRMLAVAWRKRISSEDAKTDEDKRKERFSAGATAMTMDDWWAAREEAMAMERRI